MPIAEPTTWRWPDSTFGQQKNVPFSDNLQYPDCGPSRIYTLENILYGLEKIITPILETIETNTAAGGVLSDVSYTRVTSASSSPLPTAAAKKVTLINLSTNTAPIEVEVGTGGAVIPLEPGYSLVCNVSNANRIAISQPGGEAETLYYIVSN